MTATPTPRQMVRAHQYLYYCTARPIWSDYDYDRYCIAHQIQGGGGSDRASDYSPEDVALAEAMCAAPRLYRVPWTVRRLKREDLHDDPNGDWPEA